MDTSTFTNHCDKDILLVGSTAAEVNVTAVCELSHLLDDVAVTVFTRSPERALFKRWVLDGRIWDSTACTEQTVSAEDLARRLLAPERIAAGLVAGIAAIKLEPPPAFEFAVNNSPLAVLDKIEAMVASGGELAVDLYDLSNAYLPNKRKLIEQAVRCIMPELTPPYFVIPIKVVRCRLRERLLLIRILRLHHVCAQMLPGFVSQSQFLIRVDGALSCRSRSKQPRLTFSAQLPAIQSAKSRLASLKGSAYLLTRLRIWFCEWSISAPRSMRTSSFRAPSLWMRSSVGHQVKAISLTSVCRLQTR